MKQSVYTKTISISGINGTMSGLVLATMNADKKIVPGHNPSSHEDTTHEVYTHKVQAYVNQPSGEPKILKEEVGITTEDEVLRISGDLIFMLTEHLTAKANELKPDPIFDDKMKELFK